MNISLRYLVLMSGMFFTSFVASKYHVVKSSDQLEKLVDDYQYSIVCFAPSGKKQGEYLDRDVSKALKKEFKKLSDIVKSASERSDYKKFLSKDVGFIVIDTASKQADDTQTLYNLQEMPICLVFEQGAAVSGKRILRPASVRDLTKVLEQIGGDDLKKILNDRREEDNLERQERIARYWAYGSYYPYGYGPYGYGYWGGWPHWRHGMYYRRGW